MCRVPLSAAGAVIVVITARTAESAAVQALDGGADDFVLKPFRQVELLARLRAYLRRREISDPMVLQAGTVRVDQTSRRAWVGGEVMELRPKELELLSMLMARAGEAIRREEIVDPARASRRTVPFIALVIAVTIAAAAAATTMSARRTSRVDATQLREL